MITGPATARYAVYLLHFPHPASGCAHYVGITSPHRVGARMREHAGGRGAKSTSAITRNSTPFALARLWLTDLRYLEKEMIELGTRIGSLCPVCAGARPISAHRPTKKAALKLPPLDGWYLALAAEKTALPGKPSHETSLIPEDAGPSQSRVHP